MNLKASLVLVFISLAPCLTIEASAMSILDFGRMNNDDEASYVTLLVEGSATLFKAHGQPDQAQRLLLYFKVPGKEGGVYHFGDHLKEANAVNNRNAINPNNRVPVYRVEDAMAATLKEAGFIISPNDLLAMAKDFRPSGPPRQHSAGF